MSLFDKIRAEFIDIVEWLDDTQDTIAYRFERYDNEIKMGAKLVVRPGQAAVFVNEGHVADVFGPGTYTLETQNMPILSTLKGWKYGFHSPFKAEVYFFNTKVFTNLKWGTSNPVILKDPELGPVRLRAYGSYTMQIVEPATTLEKLISTDGLFQTDEIENQLRSFLLVRLVTWLGASHIPLFEFAANYAVMGDAVRDALQPDFAQYGLSVPQVQIENISLPPEVEAALDKRTQIGLVGDLGKYTQYQAANAIEASAHNPGGGNPALDLAMGLAMGQQVARQINVPTADAGGAPPPLPAATAWYLGVNGQRLGPFDAAALQQQIAAGALAPTTLVWKQGMAGWIAAGDVPEVSVLLGAAPPPLPPA